MRYLYNTTADKFYEIKKIENFGSYFQGNYLIEGSIWPILIESSAVFRWKHLSYK